MRDKALAHDVFISYSSTDNAAAMAVCHGLESRGFTCWIAPRDVLPGTSFEDSIIEAIKNCRIFVLIYSGRSNRSHHVENEVRIAWNRGTPIIAFRLEDVPFNNVLNYYIGSTHWLDVQGQQMEASIVRLSGDVRQLIKDARPAAAPESVPPKPAQAGAAKIALGMGAMAVAIICIAIVAAYMAGMIPAGGPGDNSSIKPTIVPDPKPALVPPGSIPVSTPDLPANVSGFKIQVVGGLNPNVTIGMAEMRNMTFVRLEKVEKRQANGNIFVADYTGIPFMAVLDRAGLPGGNLSFRVISEDGFAVTFTQKQLEYSIIAFYMNDEPCDVNMESNAIKIVPMGLSSEFWIKMPTQVRIYQQ
jgi:hypothetical protein